mmetsp:Transcript_9367/g.18711  ORF Transcript_9367/g.18711 Transcript_9367/m.18711 type:complete len:298 (+) Transcript_9367:1320-2213(+)
MHAAHKLLGRKGGKEKPGSNPLNIHTQFKDYLLRNEKHAELAMLQSLGCIVGERFWARCKQAALLYSLIGEMRTFLATEHRLLKKSRSASATENQLEHSVRSLSCFSLFQQKFGDEQIARNQIRVIVEVRVYGIWHHAVMTVCLQASVMVVQVASGQRPVLQKLHRFITKVATDPAFRRLLITEHAVPVTFENFECEGWVGCIPFVGPPSAAQDESYRRIFARNDWRNVIARQMGQFRKDALNMFHGNGTAAWLDSLTLEEGVEEWTSDNVHAKGKELIESKSLSTGCEWWEQRRGR